MIPRTTPTEKWMEICCTVSNQMSAAEGGASPPAQGQWNVQAGDERESRTAFLRGDTPCDTDSGEISINQRHLAGNVRRSTVTMCFLASIWQKAEIASNIDKYGR